VRAAATCAFEKSTPIELAPRSAAEAVSHDQLGDVLPALAEAI